MKHAGQEALANLEPLLSRLRHIECLVERSPGTFYLGSKAFLHFHEDASGLFADVKDDLVNFTRYRVSTQAERGRLLSHVRRCLSRFTATSASRER